MARKTKDGKESKAAEKLIKEQAETDKNQAAREAKMTKAEEKALKKAKEESDNQAPPVAEPKRVPDSKLAEAWKKFLAEYKESNPKKYADKEARGEFKNIPDSFTGTDQINIKG